MEEEGAELKFETTMMIICKHDLGWILLAAAAPIIIITTSTNVKAGRVCLPGATLV